VKENSALSKEKVQVLSLKKVLSAFLFSKQFSIMDEIL
jgi:hypothetical protein